MAHTIPILFDTYADAERAVQRLEAGGIAHDDISVVSNNSGGEHMGSSDAVASDAGKGASAGAVLGGAGGLLAGLGALAIPGLGPIVAVGWLASTAVGVLAGGAVGAAAGGLVGALTHSGVSHEDAGAYAEGVRRGGTLVTVKAKDDMVPRVQELFTPPYRAVNIIDRRLAYQQAGWSRFDETAEPYTADQVLAERTRYERL